MIKAQATIPFVVCLTTICFFQSILDSLLSLLTIVPHFNEKSNMIPNLAINQVHYKNYSPSTAPLRATASLSLARILSFERIGSEA